MSRAGELAETRSARTRTETINVHELVENDKFYAKLDGVCERLGAGLVDPVSDIDLDDKNHIQHNTQDVQVDEKFSRSFGFGRIAWLEHFERGTDVYDGDGQLLQGEDDQLNPFVDVVNLQPHSRVLLVAAKRQHRGRDLEEQKIDDDHGEDESQHTLIADDEVQARVQHQALARHHPPPAKGGKGRVHRPWTAPHKPLQDNAGRVTHDAPRGQQDGPKVECVTPFEGGENFQVDDEGHVDSQGEHRYQERCSCRIFRQWSAKNPAGSSPFVQCHHCGRHGIDDEGLA